LAVATGTPIAPASVDTSPGIQRIRVQRQVIALCAVTSGRPPLAPRLCRGLDARSYAIPTFLATGDPAGIAAQTALPPDQKNRMCAVSDQRCTAVRSGATVNASIGGRGE